MRTRVGLLLVAFLVALVAPLAEAEMPSAIDLADYFPNKNMATTHKLVGSQPGTDWDLVSVLGSFDVFRLGGRGPAWDTYAVFPDSIALMASAWIESGDTSVLTYLSPYPALARHLDLSTLPHEMVQTSYYAMRTPPGVTLTGENTVRVTISRDGDRVRLHWRSPNGPGFETLWIGDVPIEESSLTAPGIIRYATNTVTPPIDTEFSWHRR